MSIIINTSYELVIADADTTNFDFGTNQATKISTLRELTVSGNTESIIASKSRLSATSNRVPSTINVGHSGYSIKLKTYLKPVTQNSVVTSPEKLLWESLSATNTVDNVITSTVSFISGNVNKLRELYLYVVFPDGSYYKFSRIVVAGVALDVSLENIAMAEWDLRCIDIDYIDAPTTGTPLDMTNKVYIRNKLSTLSLIGNSKTYDLTILKARINIINNVNFIKRTRLGQRAVPTGHYVTDRITTASFSCYLNDKVLGSSVLQEDVLGFSTITTLNTLFNATLSIGGSNNDLRINVNMPTSKVGIQKPVIGQTNMIDFTITPQESSLGSGDEISLVYNN